MRKTFLTLLAAGVALVACQKETELKPESLGEKVTITLTASNDNATKTTLSGTNATWAEGDKVTVMYKKTGESSWSTAQSSAAVTADAYATATFEASLTTPDGSENAYAIYPANNLSQTVADQAKITIAATQHPTSTSFDGASDIMISKPFTPSASPIATQFARANAVLKISIDNATLSSEKLVSLSVEGENDLAGDVLVGLSDHAVKGIENGSHTVTAEYAPANQFTVSGNFVYLIVKPQTLASGSHLIISGATENYSFYRDITLGENIHLNAGHIIPLNIDITSILRMPTDKSGWYRIEAASWLKVGDKVAIVANGYNFALSTTQETSYRGRVAISKTTDGDYSKLTINDDVQLFDVVAGSSIGTIAFKSSNGTQINKYIYAASSSSNDLKSKEALDGNCSFTISISGSEATLLAQGSYTRNLLQYNNSATRFSCYGGAQQAIAIYKKYSLPQLDGLTIVATPDHSEKTITVTWDDIEHATNYAVECTGQSTKNVGTGIETATFTGLSYDTEYTIKVTATADGYESSVSNEQIITLTDPSAKTITRLKASITGVDKSGVINATETGVYSLTNATDGDLTVTVDGTVVTSASVSGGALTYSVAANTGAPRNGSVTIEVEGGNSIDVTICQIGLRTYSMTLDSSTSGLNNVHWTSVSQTSVSYGGITWSTSVTGTSTIVSQTTNAQIGKKDDPATAVSLSTTGFAGKTIKSVTVNGFCQSNTGPTISITAGGTTMLSATPLVKTTATDYVTTSDPVTLSSGQSVSINFASSVKAAINICSVTVQYYE